MQYFAYKDRSIFEDILKQEIAKGSGWSTRIRLRGILSVCGAFPFEITIMPRRQSAYYSTSIRRRFC